MTQCEQLIRELRRRSMTYGELLALRISTAPWKRLEESAHRHLKAHEKLDRIKRRDGLVAFKIVRATKWTA